MFYSVMIAAAANFILNLLFIPRFGFIGASVSTAFGFIIYTALIYLSSFKHTRWILPWYTLIKAALLTLVLVIITVNTKLLLFDTLSPIWNMIIGLIYFLLYFILLFIIGEIPFKKRKI